MDKHELTESIMEMIQKAMEMNGDDLCKRLGIESKEPQLPVAAVKVTKMEPVAEVVEEDDTDPEDMSMSMEPEEDEVEKLKKRLMKK